MTSIDELKRIFAATLDPQAQFQAAARLQELKKMPNYTVSVVQLVAQLEGPHDAPIRHAAAINFKNTIRYGWDPEKHQDAQENIDLSEGINISETDRQAIKQNLVQLMCTTPDNVQKQLSEAISLIAESDYPYKWMDLMPTLARQFESPDMNAVTGALGTADSVCMRFRYVARSDQLYAVIQHTLETIAHPLTVLMTKLGNAVSQPTVQQNKAQLTAYMEQIRLVCSIFYSLNYQDLPEFFEDNMATWVTELQKYLQPGIFGILEVADEEENPSPMDKVQEQILDIFRLYADKDEEDFVNNFLAKLVSLVFDRLMATTMLRKHDGLATRSIRFFSSLLVRAAYVPMFQTEGTLPNMVERIILPNLQLREMEIENFEDQPKEFMLTEIEGSDSESRRSAVQDLLRSMCRFLEKETVEICTQHIHSLLQRFSANPNDNWAAKDVAIHLFISIAIRRENMLGVAEINPSVDVLDFFVNQILPELQDTSPQRPIVKAAAIKFVSTFRKQFTHEHCVLLLPFLISHLSSTSVVVHTFSAHTIERMLVTKDDSTNRVKIGAAELSPQLNNLFEGLFRIVDNTDLEENDYVMKCMMRALIVGRREIMPHTELVVHRLTSALQRVAANPKDPKFNHYLFESLAILIKSVCSVQPEAVEGFEGLLTTPFLQILQNQVAEFTPYVFQILAQLVDFRSKEAGMTSFYVGLLESIKKPENWSQKGNIPALTRLIKAYVEKFPAEIVQGNHTAPILGIYQKLISTNITQSKGVELMNSIFIHFDSKSLEPFLKEILRLGMHAFVSRNTAKSRGNLASLLGVFVAKYNGTKLRAICDGLFNDLFIRVLRLWSQSLLEQTPVRFVDAKIQVFSVSRLLFEDSSIGLGLLTNDPVAFANLILAIGKIVSSDSFTRQARTEGLDEDDFADVQFDSQFSELKYARPLTPVDPTPDKDTINKAFVNGLAKMSSQCPGAIGTALEQSTAKSDLKETLRAVLAQHGTQIA